MRISLSRAVSSARPDPKTRSIIPVPPLSFVLAIALAPLLGSAAFAEEEKRGHAHEHAHEDHGVTETIVVTASPLEHDRDELAVPVERVGRDELLLNLGSTLGETLSHIPGVATTGFAAGASRPVIRGQDAYRTEVLEDGLRTHDVSRESPDHAVPVNPLAARRVEVVRGPAALRYGGGASAGAVNVITNRVPDSLSSESIGGEVFGGVGLFANERDLALDLEGSHGDFAWHADGVMRRSNDYPIPNDDRPHNQNGSGTESWMGSLGGAWIGEAGRVGLSFTRAESIYDIPEEGVPVEIDMKTDRVRFEIDLFEPARGIRSVRARGVYSDYQHEEVAGGVTGQTYSNEEFEGRLEILHQPVAGWTGAIGFHGTSRDFEAGGEAAEFLAQTDTATAAVYLFEERPLSDVFSLEAGFRVEHTRVQGLDAADFNRDLDFTPLSGSLGLVAIPNDWLLIGMNASVSQRAPSQVELLARGAHEATQTFELGDPGLDEETSYTGELRIEIEPEWARFEVAGFVTQYDDFIFAGLTGNQLNIGGDLFDELLYRNRDALFYGLEFQGEVDAFELDCGTFGVDGRFDLVRARFDSNLEGQSKDVSRMTPVRWGAGLFFRSEATQARVGFVRTEGQKHTGTFESRTNGFTYLNASLSHRVDAIEAVPLELTITARNLTDVRGRNHLSFNKDEVLLPGRMVRFGVRAQF